MAIQHDRDLVVWQKGMALAVKCYEVTRGFLRAEIFGLTSQIRRAATSIPSNIAEGHSRTHTKEFLNHLSIAKGSLAELETLLTLSHQVGFLTEATLQEVLPWCAEISRMIAALRKSLEQRLEQTAFPRPWPLTPGPFFIS